MTRCDGQLRKIRWIGACILVLAVYAVGTEPVLAVEPGAQNKLKERRHYAFVYAGGFETVATVVVLGRATGNGSFGAGWGWRFHRFLTFELDMNISSTDYELPQPTIQSHLGNANLTLSTVGALGNLKFGRQLGRLRPQIGVGLGAGVVDMALSGPGFWFPESLESELSILTQVLAGIDIRVSRRSHVGIEYRKLFAHRRINFGGGVIDGGGESFVLTYRLAM